MLVIYIRLALSSSAPHPKELTSIIFEVKSAYSNFESRISFKSAKPDAIAPSCAFSFTICQMTIHNNRNFKSGYRNYKALMFQLRQEVIISLLFQSGMQRFKVFKVW